MRCGTSLEVPAGMRAAALGLAVGLPGEGPLPVSVSCELDKHDQGEHAARLRELFDGAVWVMWEGDEIKVQPIAYCESFRSSHVGISMSSALCWLPDAHLGGHTWERCA
ncbi:hypothetical protein QQM39_26975 [Streptomyces sp. DT2A-34]|uniref:hypothetical protein n=1 Tax=Streptomyces sp. DT2A-34 TaxID=3051182 RepID=UPI00265C3633|nr:hypothetical protein [Streptomyces sp. DT2A-34]MDO0914341.1 hypothetical protein [Streptomyces sp. DT2A-34]